MNEEAFTLFDFDNSSNLSQWYIVDDVVMGGRSNGNFDLDKNGNGVFYGDVSLENYGGFSSVQYRFETKDITNYSHIKIKLKGDAKSYQFRTKTKQGDPQSYIYKFQTTGDWETIEIPLAEMYPSFRGRKLDMPNYPVEQLSQLSFLISNKKVESFRLEIDKIEIY